MLASMDRHLQQLALVAVVLLLAACGTMPNSVVVEPAGGGAYGHAGSAMNTPPRTSIPGGYYVVVRGDTLYSIAFRNGVDFRDLAQWNAIAAPYTIWPGQRLTLSPPGNAAIAHDAGRRPARSAPVFVPVRTPSPASSAATAPERHAVAPAKPATPATSATAVAAPVRRAAPPVAGGGASRTVSGVIWRWPAEGSVITRFQSGDAIPGIEIAGKSGDPVRAAADGVVVYSGNGLVGYGELVIIKHSDSFLSAYGHNRKRLVKEGERVTAGQEIAEMGSTGASRNELEFQIRKDGNPVDPLSYLPSR
ncbi:MAG: peptidoglycan DD-metalloendopeptidase family protein [Xanthomonadaceae bacterium]|jgi:lipoprotein NlpD|nr:peptidoglycan DD-metalloendopeptidase family protein [Xanthomonadaceae bacterium]MDE3073291.1 peptidoglycan DD-metalloendopeptidase family protein [Pseudomonadota bacterium]